MKQAAVSSLSADYMALYSRGYVSITTFMRTSNPTTKKFTPPTPEAESLVGQYACN
jgi:hypothetical protein